MITMPGVLVCSRNPGSQRLEDQEFEAILSYRQEGNVREGSVKLP